MTLDWIRRHKYVLLVAGPLLLTLIWPAIERIRGGRALASALREMERLGEPLTLQAVADAEPPPTNALVLTSVQFERRFAPFASIPIRLLNLPQFRIVAPGKAVPAWRLETNAGGVPLATLEEQLDWELLDRLCRELNWQPVRIAEPPSRDPGNLVLDYLSPARRGVQLFVRAAELAARRGRLDEAVELLRAADAVIRMLRARPLFIDHLAATACRVNMVQGLWAVLPAEGWTDAQLAALAALCRDDGALSACARSLRGERAFMLRSFPDGAMPGAGPRIPPPVVFGLGSGGLSSWVEWLPFLSSGMKQWLKGRLERVEAGREALWWHSVSWPADKARLLVESQRFIEAVESFVQRPDEGVPDILRSGFVVAPSEERRFPVTSSLREVFFGAWLKAGVSQTLCSLAEAAVALERHRLRYGRYPESLEALVPEFLEAVPRDWMDGRPLRYRLEGPDRFRLWSVGENRIDDGGDPTGSGGQTDWLRGKDLVWPEAVEPPPGR